MTFAIWQWGRRVYRRPCQCRACANITVGAYTFRFIALMWVIGIGWKSRMLVACDHCGTVEEWNGRQIIDRMGNQMPFIYRYGWLCYLSFFAIVYACTGHFGVG